MGAIGGGEGDRGGELEGAGGFAVDAVIFEIIQCKKLLNEYCFRTDSFRCAMRVFVAMASWKRARIVMGGRESLPQGSSKAETRPALALFCFTPLLLSPEKVNNHRHRFLTKRGYMRNYQLFHSCRP